MVLEREAKSQFHALTHRKRRRYVVAKEIEDAHAFKKRPRHAWRKLQAKRSNVMGDFTDDAMLSYVKRSLYTQRGTRHRMRHTNAITQ